MAQYTKIRNIPTITTNGKRKSCECIARQGNNIAILIIIYIYITILIIMI